MNSIDLLLNNEKKEPLQEPEVIKDESFQTKTLTFIYNKKWLILIGICLLLVIIYIYKYDVPLAFTCPMPKLTKKSTDSTCDDISELNDDIAWNLEDEIKKYMDLQDSYIQKMNK